MTRRDEIDSEIRKQAVRLYPQCVALFELPRMVYTKIIADDNRDIEVFAHHKAALKEVIKDYHMNKTPMTAYFGLEDWLYKEDDKPIEIKSAMIRAVYGWLVKWGVSVGMKCGNYMASL